MKKVLLVGLVSGTILMGADSGVENVNFLKDGAKKLVTDTKEKINQVTTTTITDNNQTGSSFKETVANKINKKLENLDLTLKKYESQKVQSLPLTTQPRPNSKESKKEPLPVMAGSTILTLDNKVVSKQAIVIDESGNKYSVTESNNNIVKKINAKSIKYKKGNELLPILVSNELVQKKPIAVKSTTPIANTEVVQKVEKKELPSLSEAVKKELDKGL